MNRKMTTRVCVVALLSLGLLSVATKSAFATAEGGSISENSFNLSAGVINAGQSVTASSNFSLSNHTSSGGAGTTTRGMNTNTITYSGSGTANLSQNVNAGGSIGTTSQTFTTGSLSYFTPGVYSVNLSGTLSWTAQENSSYGFGQGNPTASQGFSDSRLLTVLNVAPQSVTLSLASNVINIGQSDSASMTATSPGTDQLTFNVNGNIVVDPNTTPGSTRGSGSVGLGTYNVPGVYTITGNVADNFGGSTNAANQLLTVLDVAPTINSLGINTRVPVINGASDMITFIASATSPGNLPLTYAWNLSGAGGPYNDQVGNNPTTAVQYFIGTHTISVQVSDGYGGVATQNFVFTVIPEPASLVLAGLGGIVALAMFRRRKRC